MESKAGFFSWLNYFSRDEDLMHFLDGHFEGFP